VIRLLQHYTQNFKPLIDISKPIHEAYCERHGYSFHLKEVPEYGVYNGLDKLSQIMEVCSDGDIAMVCDADALVTNLNVKIEDFIKEGKDFYVAQGWNMGVFIVRITTASIKLINHLFFWIKNDRFNCEQDAFEFYMQMYLLSDATDIILTVKHPCFNSFLPELYLDIKEERRYLPSAWEPSHFALHVPALSIEKRIEVLKEYSQYVVYE